MSSRWMSKTSGSVVAARVAVRRGDQQKDRAPGRDGGAVVLDVLASRSAPSCGPVGSKRSVSSIAVGISDAVLDDLAPLIGVLGEHLGEPADQPAGGLVAGAGDDRRVGEHLLSR